MATKNNYMLPEEEQQAYIDNGGVLPINGTNAAYARQRRNGNVAPVTAQRDDNSVDSKDEDVYAENNVYDVVTLAPAVATPTYSEPPKPSHWYEQVFKEENGDLNLSEEDRKKLRRRERAERTIAGLGDLGAHIANVWGAAKGSTPAKIDKTMSEAYDKKWREMGLDYDQRRRAYNAGLSAARKMDYQQYLNDRKQYLAEQRETRMWEKQRADNELKYVKQQIDRAELDLKFAKDEREKEYYRSRINKLQEEANNLIDRREHPDKYRGSRGGSGSSSSSGGASEGKYKFLGESYRTIQDRNDAVRKWALEHNVPLTKGKKGSEREVDLNLLRLEIERGTYNGANKYDQYKVNQ